MMQTVAQKNTPTVAPTTMGDETKGLLLATPKKRLKQPEKTSQPRHQKQGISTAFFDKNVIREALPFARLMEHYNVEVLANGQCRCPFHEDNRPSASIKGGFFHCFVCNKSHDVFSFVMAMEYCSFQESVAIAANIAGLALPEQNSISRRQIALAVQERKHDTAERRRVTMSSEQKYLLLATVARTVRQNAPEWLAKLDGLLDDWLHGVPDDVDLRPLLTLVQGKHLEAIGPVVDRLHAEQEWVNHA